MKRGRKTDSVLIYVGNIDSDRVDSSLFPPLGQIWVLPPLLNIWNSTGNKV